MVDALDSHNRMTNSSVFGDLDLLQTSSPFTFFAVNGKDETLQASGQKLYWITLFSLTYLGRPNTDRPGGTNSLTNSKVTLPWAFALRGVLHLSLS